MTNAQTRYILMIPLVMLITAMTACGGVDRADTAGTIGNKTMLVLVSNAQAAQAASAGIQAGRNTATFGVKLHNLATEAGPVVNAFPGIGSIPVTFDCGNRLPILFGRPSTPDTTTIVKDRGTGVISADFNTCRIGATTVHGALTFSESAPGAQVFTLGSAAGPIMITEFAGPASQVETAVFTASATLTFTKGAAFDTLIVSGSIDTTDRVRGSRDRFDLDNVSLTVTKSVELIGAEPYDAATLLINGAVTRTSFASDIDPTVSHTESNTFSDFAVVFKTPAAGSTATAQFLGVSGQFSVATTPPGRCIDGAFTVLTDVEVQIDKTTGITTAGRLTVNSTAVATLSADGGITASVSGSVAATFTRAEITTLCAL